MNNYGRELTAVEIEAGYHRDFIGGMWDEMGALQLKFLVEQGLRPDSTLLDVGCGSLRGGVWIAEYLDPNCYFGLDINRSLVDAGYEHEFTDELRAKVPREHLVVTDCFDVSELGDVTFDVAFAQSVFTHLPVNAIRRCLVELGPRMREGGQFFATYFEAPTREYVRSMEHAGGTVTFPDRDPYHYPFDEFATLAHDLGWGCHRVGDWGHPKGQFMLRFTPGS